MTTSDQKKVLREKLRAQRELLTEKEVKYASEAVCERLKTYLGVPIGKQLHVYTAKTIWNEIDIAPYIEWLKEKDSDISVNIAEHMPIQAIPSEQYDIVLIPMLGFDSTRRRLGMGMGWYDMFLARQHHALKIGIAYDWAEVDELTAEDHDVVMDVIVTPAKILT